MIKSFILAFTLVFGFIGATHAQSDPLAKCFAENTTGKDRTALVRWLFVAVGVHPELRSLVITSKESTDEANKTMGALVTRLLTENCKGELRASVKNGEMGQAMRRAFEGLGKLAVSELVSNDEVAVSLPKYADYIDKAKLAATLTSK